MLLRRLFFAAFLLGTASSLSAASLCLANVTVPTTGPWFQVQKNGTVRAHIWSASGSTATVLVECAANPLDPAVPDPGYPVFTVTNPSATGAYPTGPCSYVRVHATVVSSGQVSATLEATEGLIQVSQ